MSIMFEFESEIWLLIGVIAVAAHVAWLLLSRVMHPLYVLAAVFLVLSPFAQAVLLPAFPALKMGRVYCTLLLFAVGLFLVRNYRIGAASVSFFVFITWFTAGVLWSDQLWDGLLYKGLFWLLAMGGVFLGNTVRSLRELKQSLRVLLAASIVWVIIIGLDIAATPGQIGRLRSYGMNPNFIAITSAFYFIICAYIALYDDSKFHKTLAYGTGVAAGVIVPFTGSRAGMGMALLAAMIILMPLARRPMRFVAVSVLVSITIYLVVIYVQPEGADRFLDLQNTREHIWRSAWELVVERPLFGHGWVYGRSVFGSIASANLHSMYLQVLAEIGILGGIAFLLAMICAGGKLLGAMRLALKTGVGQPAVHLVMAMLAATLANGIFEAAALVGTSPNALFFGFSIGLVDRLRQLILSEAGGQNIGLDYAQAETDPWLNGRRSVETADSF